MITQKRIDIDKELSKIWQRVYTEIIDHAKVNGLIGQTVPLEKCRVKAYCVDDDGVLTLTDYDGHVDYAENFEDGVLYEVYKSIPPSCLPPPLSNPR